MSNIIRKNYCEGCPYDYGQPATEMAYNLGCLPSIAEINSKTTDKSWACHSNSNEVCCGFASFHKERIDMPLLLEKGIHY